MFVKKRREKKNTCSLEKIVKKKKHMFVKKSREKKKHMFVEKSREKKNLLILFIDLMTFVCKYLFVSRFKQFFFLR